VERIVQLKAEQLAIDSRMVANRNPDPVMLNMYIDLHGCGKQQGERICWDYLREKEAQLSKGLLQPNRDSQTHVVQVITGPGKLELHILDFLKMAGFPCYNCNGATLVRLTTSHVDANAHMARVGLFNEMLQNHQDAWENEKASVCGMKKQKNQEQKAKNKAERQEHKCLKKAERQEFKAERQAERHEFKAGMQAERQAFRAKIQAEKKECNEAERQEFRASMQAKREAFRAQMQGERASSSSSERDEAKQAKKAAKQEKKELRKGKNGEAKCAKKEARFAMEA
jgi:hypothetical protein